VAPLGELLPDGSRLKPNPEEFVRLGDGLRDRDGLYSFQITDEMREADYLDQLRLIAVDHPASEEVYANEIYSSSTVRPALYAMRDKRFPVSAVDDHGSDVLPLIRERDGRYPTGFRRNRILGLADLHTLTLDLGDFPGPAPLHDRGPAACHGARDRLCGFGHGRSRAWFKVATSCWTANHRIAADLGGPALPRFLDAVEQSRALQARLVRLRPRHDGRSV